MFPVDRVLAFTERFEGHVPWMYLDVEGLVTIGYGDLIDPLALAHGLVFLRPDGTEATPSEVSAAWLTVKNRQDMRQGGGGAFGRLTTLRVSEASLSALVLRKLQAFEGYLRALFPRWDDWPESAQLGTLSMAWAMGTGRFADYPHFVVACRAEDWLGAADECHMSEVGQNASFHDRNLANEALFRAAAREEDTSPDVTAGGRNAPVYAVPSPES